jgi:hypothetical protein
MATRRPSVRCNETKQRWMAWLRSRTAPAEQEHPSIPAERANDFRPLLRMYEPDAAVFDGRYDLPPITRRSSVIRPCFLDVDVARPIRRLHGAVMPRSVISRRSLPA